MMMMTTPGALHNTRFARLRSLHVSICISSRASRGKFDLKGLCSMGGIDSLKREEALDAAAEGDSKSLRKPCAGKPCFDVIKGMSSD